MALVTIDKFIATELEGFVMEALSIAGVLNVLNKEGYIVAVRGIQEHKGLMDTDPKNYEAEIERGVYLRDSGGEEELTVEQLTEPEATRFYMFTEMCRRFNKNILMNIYTDTVGLQVVDGSVYMVHRLKIKLLRNKMDDFEFTEYMMETIANTVI